MKVVFMHIPKCAGTSVHQLLKKNFKNDDFFSERLNFLDKYSVDELESKKVFSGHYDAWRIGHIPGSKFVFTFMREPQKRVVSLYNFWRSHTWSAIEKYELGGPKLAKSNSFVDFLKIGDQGIPANVENVMTRMAIGRTESPEVINLLEQQPNKAYDVALNYYKSLNYVGIVENIDVSVRQLSSMLCLKDGQISHANETKTTSLPSTRESVPPIEICDEASSLLSDLTAIDQKIYNYFNEAFFCPEL